MLNQKNAPFDLSYQKSCLPKKTVVIKIKAVSGKMCCFHSELPKTVRFSKANSFQNKIKEKMYRTLVDLLVDLYIDSTLTCGLLETSGTGEVLGERRPPPSKNLERQI